MTYEEFLTAFKKLEIVFEKELSEPKLKAYYEEFRGMSLPDFHKVVNLCVKRYEKFPSIASIYKVMDELGISAVEKKWRIVKPYVHYQDQDGYTYTLVSETGECSNPPDEIVKRYGDDVRILRRIYL